MVEEAATMLTHGDFVCLVEWGRIAHDLNICRVHGKLSHKI